MRYINPESEVTFKEVLLNRLRVRSQMSLASYALASARPEVLMDHAADQLVARLEAELLTDQRDGKTFTIEEPAVYETWLDHLLHTLPPESFRYRWLKHFIGHDPKMRKVTHEIDVKVSDTFPESTLRLQETLGPARVAIQYSDFPHYYGGDRS